MCWIICGRCVVVEYCRLKQDPMEHMISLYLGIHWLFLNRSHFIYVIGNWDSNQYCIRVHEKMTARLPITLTRGYAPSNCVNWPRMAPWQSYSSHSPIEVPISPLSGYDIKPTIKAMLYRGTMSMQDEGPVWSSGLEEYNCKEQWLTKDTRRCYQSHHPVWYPRPREYSMAWVRN
jgi:hypothetical protein